MELNSHTDPFQMLPSKQRLEAEAVCFADEDVGSPCLK